jgi:kumamolisin
MADFRPRLELPGTAPAPLRDAVRRSEAPDLGQRITVTVVVRSRVGEDALAEALDAVRKRLPHERAFLGHEEHARRFGSLQEDLDAVQAFAAEHGLEVVEVSPERHVVVLAGPLAAFARAFGVRFHLFDHPARPFRSHEGAVTIPRELRGIVEDVIGLDDRPLEHPRAAAGEAAAAAEALTALVHTDPRTIAKYYQFPEGVTGAGQCVAILQFGGGYYPSDMDAYFRLRGIKLPQMEIVELDGQTNQPGSPEAIRAYAVKLGLIPSGLALPDPDTSPDSASFWATVECTMDLQILGTVAPEARFVTYLAPGTPQGKYNAFSRAIYDSKRSPSVINCSWGSCENQTPQSLLRSLDKLFQEAAVKGVTICASAGDSGDGSSKCGGPSVNCPADSPYVLACGGSSVAADLSRETSWYEVISGFAMSGGGGYSAAYAMPDWQKEAGIGAGAAGGQSGRALPDVAAKADVLKGYDVVVAGLDIPMGGSSAAAPMWAGLAALINQKLGRPVGYLTPHLYSPSFAKAVRDITESGGGSCKTGPGWDVCTGLGSPVGTALLAALSGSD